MRPFILSHLLLLLVATTLTAQEKPKNGFKTLNFEFMAGLISSPVVGVDAKAIRNSISEREADNPNFSGSVLPKSSAYVGILVDYRFHENVSIGSGMVYSPKGYWVFEKNEATDFRNRTYYTVDYFEFPLFLQVYAHPKVWFRAGPVFSFAGITKVRILTDRGNETTKEKYRFGENGSPTAREFVPGLEAAVSFGNPSGFHGTVGVNYSGSLYEELDVKPVMLRLGFGYTLVK